MSTMDCCADTGELFSRRMSEEDIAHHMAICQKRNEQRAETRKAGARKAAATRQRLRAQYKLFERET